MISVLVIIINGKQPYFGNEIVNHTHSIDKQYS